MDGSCASEGEQREVPRIAAALNSMHPRGVGHVLVDDLIDGPGCAGEVQPERLGQATPDGTFGRGHVKRHSAAQEIERVQVAEDEVSVSHCRLQSAHAVASWAWVTAGRVWPHLDQPKAVHTGNAAAARPDLDQLNATDLDRQPRTLLEPLQASDLEFTRNGRAALFDQAGLRGRPAHVERQQVWSIDQPAQVRRRQGSGGRA